MCEVVGLGDAEGRIGGDVGEPPWKCWRVLIQHREDSAHVSTEEVRPGVSGAGGPDGDGAPITTPHSVLNSRVRALTALARVTHRVRITSTVPDLVFGIAVEVWLRTARAICSASRRSDLPSPCRASRLGRLTSTTRSPALVSARVRVAPNEPVLSTSIARTGPCSRIQTSSRW